MNIKRLAIQCGMFNEASILNAALFDKSLNDFAQAVIAQFISEQKPVAIVVGHREEIKMSFRIDKALPIKTNLYTLGGQP